MKARVLCLAAIVMSAPVAAVAQITADGKGPTSEAIRWGIVSFDTRFRLTNAGVDTNVFNEAENPRRDITATTGTGTDIWMRTGRGLLTLSADSEFVYFNQYSSERALSSNASALYEMRFNRLRLFGFAGTRDAKRRPNDEIRARVRHHGTDLGGGFDLRLLSKTTIRIEYRDQRDGFADDAIYERVNLKEQLTRNVRVAEATWRQQLTPLTRFVARASHDREEYDFQPVRNAESYRVNTGFELGQFALIRGTVNIGYHVLAADRPDLLPEYAGLTANTSVAYTAPTQTRIQAGLARELRQSFDPGTPHYTELGWSTTITQRISGRWDLQVTGGRVQQDYSSTSLATGRRDHVDRIGAGIGYSIAPQLRLSLDLLSYQRASDVAGRDDRGTVGGLSFTYGY